MISARAQDGFQRLLHQAVDAGLRSPAGERCRVEPVSSLQEMKAEHAVILTVSSTLFRLIAIVYFTLDEPTKRHFARVKNAAVEEMAEADFLDVIAEHGNIVCGALNRDIARHFPHVGMSTPNIIERHCADYLHELRSGMVAHCKATLEDELVVYATLCVCEDADLDFDVPRQAQVQEEACAGELEMF